MPLIPEGRDPGRSFDVTPATDSVDGVYGKSSFSPYWTGRAVPFGGFPQGAPLASNLQLALVGKLVHGARPRRSPCSPRTPSICSQLLHVEWLVDRSDPPAARPDRARSARRRCGSSPACFGSAHASPALFAPRLERCRRRAPAPKACLRCSRASRRSGRAIRSRLAASASLDALNRTGTRATGRCSCRCCAGCGSSARRHRADRFFVERTLAPGPEPAQTGAGADFAVLAHREQPRDGRRSWRAPRAPGFVRLAYSFDPDLRADDRRRSGDERRRLPRRRRARLPGRDARDRAAARLADPAHWGCSRSAVRSPRLLASSGVGADLFSPRLATRAPLRDRPLPAVRLRLLLLLFFGSGASGLIYQVVWMRALTLTLSVTVYAVTTVLCAFMAGLALGAFLAGRLADRLDAPAARLRAGRDRSRADGDRHAARPARARDPRTAGSPRISARRRRAWSWPASCSPPRCCSSPAR